MRPRRAPVLVAALLVAVSLPGCTAGDEGVTLFRRDEAPPAPYYREHAADLGRAHSADYAVPVDEDAQALVAVLALSTRTHGLPQPDAPPAVATLRLLAPDGTELANQTANVNRPIARIEMTQALAPGEHTLRVEGEGVSEALQDTQYGAQYTLTVEVDYGG